MLSSVELPCLWDSWEEKEEQLPTSSLLPQMVEAAACRLPLLYRDGSVLPSGGRSVRCN